MFKKNNDESKRIIKEIISNKVIWLKENYDYTEVDDIESYLNKKIYKIIKKIIKLRYGDKTTIAKLIRYNPNKEDIDPLIQGIAVSVVDIVCKKFNIELEYIRDEFIGLAYFSKFKKVKTIDLCKKNS